MGALRSSPGESAGSFPAHPSQEERESGKAVLKEEDEALGRLWKSLFGFHFKTWLSC